MEENKQKNGSQAVAGQAALKEPKMGNLFEMSLPHFEVRPPEEDFLRLFEVTMPLGGTRTFRHADPLNNQINLVVVDFLRDYIEYLQEIVSEAPISVDTTNNYKLDASAPEPTEQELAEMRVVDMAFNEAAAAELKKRQAWAKPRLKECQNALAMISARPHRF